MSAQVKGYVLTLKGVVSKKVFILGIVVLAFFMFAGVANAATINVPTDYLTIQEAINAAIPTDTIIVADGVYLENVSIPAGKDGIVLQAANTGGATIEPSSGIGIALTSSNNVTIKGFAITTTGTNAHGIWVAGTPNGGATVTGLTIQDNSITVNGYSAAVYAEQSSTAHSGWTIGGTGHGNIIIINDGVGGTGDGLDLHDVSASEVSHNTITLNNPVASTNVLWTSELSNISNLVFSNNTVSGSSGSEVAIVTDFLDASADTSITTVTVSGNTFNNWGTRALRVGTHNGAGTVTGIAINSNTFQMTEDTAQVIGGTATDKTGTGNTFNVSSTTKIQKAVDSAFSGDTINVAAGTYNESVVINKGLILQTTTGAVISPATGPGVQIEVSPALTPVTVDGFTIAPQDSTLDAAQGIVVGSAASPVATYNITISNNTITTQGQNMGILVRGVGTNGPGYPSSTGLTVTYNTITVGGDSTAFYASWVTPAHSNWSITHNTFNSPVGVNLELSDVDGVTVDTNIFEVAGSGGSGSVFIGSELSNLTLPIVFSNNDIRGNGAGSMVAFINNMPNKASTTASTMDGVTITGNTFSNWATTGRALGIYPRVSSVVVNQNSFAYASGSTALRNTSSVSIDATNNWWGDVSGPSGSGPGTGDGVSADVIFDPWWMNSAMTMPSTLITTFNTVHDSLVAAGINNNLDTCATTPNACVNPFFEKTGKGKIGYNSTMDMTDSTTVAAMQYLGDSMTMMDGKIGLNASTSLILKNSGATISIYGLNALGYTSAPLMRVLDDSGTPIDVSSPEYPALGTFDYSPDNGGTVSFTASHFTTFETNPTVTEATPVATPTSSTSPAYVFTTDVVGSVSYGGDCKSAIGLSTVGINTIYLVTSSSLPFTEGTYGNCTITITDGAGHATTLSISPFVVDTTAPIIESHENLIVEATYDAGADVSYTLPNSNDILDGTIPASCDPAPGLTFALGMTTVTCTKTDAAGNVATPTIFDITVVDTTAPTFGPSPVPLGTTGDMAVARATADDSVGATGAQISVNGGYYTDMTFVNVLGTKKRYTYDIAVPGNSTTSISYQVKIFDAAGNTATSTVGTITVTDNDAPVISGLADDLVPTKSKSWIWAATDNIFSTSTFRFLIDQDVNGVPSGEYDGTSATSQPTGTGTYYLHVQARDYDGNESLVTTVSALLDNSTSTVAKLGDNSTDVVLSAGATDLIFNEELSSSSKSAVEGALSLGADRGLTYSWSGGTLTITASEATTFVNDVVVNVSDIAGNTTSGLLLIDSNLEATQVAPITSEDGSGDAVIDSTTPEVVITNPTQAVDVTINSGTTNPTIDVSSFVSDGTGTLPQITITAVNAGNVSVAIPASTVVTSASTTWNGVIVAPTITTVALPEVTGETATLSTAIEVGFAGEKLSFDKAVRLLLPGQAEKRVGYVRTGIAFTEITNVCAADNQATGDALMADGECKINVGGDLVIWTKHFTSFAAYTRTTNPAPVVSYGGGGPIGLFGGVTVSNQGTQNAQAVVAQTPAVTNAVTPTPRGQVLGVSTFRFTKALSVGSRGDEVTELQNRLIAEGLFLGEATGYYGSLTSQAVKAFQAKYGIAQVGLVGPQTRDKLNGTSIPVAGKEFGAAVSAFARSLSQGSRGDDVTKLQERLTAEGVYTGPITGYFGALTRIAVEAYQEMKGLEKVGVVGPKTRAELNK